MTMTNSELLAYTGSDELLSHIERQRRFVLRDFAKPRPCPNCATEQTWFEAAGIAVDDLDLLTGSGDRPLSCTACRRGLRWSLPLIGGAHFELIPVAPRDEGAEPRSRHALPGVTKRP